jgi:hypothetical protein
MDIAYLETRASGFLFAVSKWGRFFGVRMQRRFIHPGSHLQEKRRQSSFSLGTLTGVG